MSLRALPVPRLPLRRPGPLCLMVGLTLAMGLFTALVAVLLIVRPRGILDEAAVHWIRRRWRQVRHAPD